MTICNLAKKESSKLYKRKRYVKQFQKLSDILKGVM